MHEKIPLAGRGDMDFNARMRNAAYLEIRESCPLPELLKPLHELARGADFRA